MLGLAKYKGEALTMTRVRFEQIQIRNLQPYVLLKTNMISYAIFGIFWVLFKDDKGGFFRVPFAKNKLWFDAMASEIEFSSIAELPQVYIV